MRPITQDISRRVTKIYSPGNVASFELLACSYVQNSPARLAELIIYKSTINNQILYVS